MSRSVVSIGSSVAALMLALSVSARGADDVRLSTVAAANGFTYQWMPTEAGATLSRPGVRIVIRAGRLFYEVNNATPINDSAPHFDGRDILVSSKLAAHLREIARSYPYPASDPDNEDVAAPSAAVGGAPGAPISLAIHARFIPGREAIALRGTGPANAALTVTLSGELSTDLPIVVLSRKTITTGKDGSFSAEVEYSQDSQPRTTLAVSVSALAGNSPAEARVVIGVPSPQIKTSGLDDWPKK